MSSEKDFSLIDNNFIDYSTSFVIPEFIWIFIGIIILLGSVGSVIPQILLIIKKNSSYGLSQFSIVLTSFGQYLCVQNIFFLQKELYI